MANPLAIPELIEYRPMANNNNTTPIQTLLGNIPIRIIRVLRNLEGMCFIIDAVNCIFLGLLGITMRISNNIPKLIVIIANILAHAFLKRYDTKLTLSTLAGEKRTSIFLFSKIPNRLRRHV